MIRLTIQIVLLVAFLAAGPAAIAMSCFLSGAPQIVFGRYEPWLSSSHDVQGTFFIECTPATSGEVMDIRVKLLSTTPGRMTMRNLDTGELLRFHLYLDPTRAVPVQDNLLFELRAPLAVTTRFPITLYGRIPAGQNVAVGSYRARFTVILDF